MCFYCIGQNDATDFQLEHCSCTRKLITQNENQSYNLNSVESLNQNSNEELSLNFEYSGNTFLIYFLHIYMLFLCTFKVISYFWKRQKKSVNLLKCKISSDRTGIRFHETTCGRDAVLRGPGQMVVGFSFYRNINSDKDKTKGRPTLVCLD